MRNEEIYNIVVRPLVTEKGTFQAQARNTYPFEVHPNANKAQIKQAIEKIYNVKVKTVRTANRKGKPRRHGMGWGATRHWKRAVVVLDAEYRIDLF
ncbi:MAG: 50S ribosomal protein L23 [Planctomycetota bacterium]|nr:50S ribosomal protein L23 [Planctomycetota bacterium]